MHSIFRSFAAFVLSIATLSPGLGTLAYAATPSDSSVATAISTKIDSAKVVTLRRALKQGDVRVQLSGDGVTTSHQNLVLSNKSKQELHVVIPAEEVFRPNAANVQMMMATKDSFVVLPPETTVTVDLPTVCVSVKSIKPPSADGTTFEVGSYPDTGLWKELAAILAASQQLFKEGAYDKLLTKKDQRRNMIAQLAIWMKLGKADGRPENAVTKEAIGDDLLTQLHIDRKQLPKEKQDRFDAGVEEIFLAADLTVGRSDKLKDGTKIPGDANFETLAQVAQRTFDNGEYADAEQLFSASLTDAKQASIADERLASILLGLSSCLSAEGKNEKAESIIVIDLLPAQEKLSGPDSPPVGITLRHLGTIYLAEKKFDAARQAFERSVAIGEKINPPALDLALSLTSLGDLYVMQGENKTAEKSLRKALDIRTQLKDTFSADMAAVKKNLAVVLLKEGKLKESEALLQEALACDATVLGNDHPYVAVILLNLAQVMDAEKRSSEAQQLIARANVIKEKSLGAKAILEDLPNDYQALSRQANFVSGVDLIQVAVTDTKNNSALVEAEKKEVAARLNRKVKDKWALVVGISNFQDPTINLRYAAKDARDFGEFLVKESNFKRDHVHLLINEKATRENVLSQLGDKWLPHVAGPDDVVVIFISSHGSPSRADVAGVNYLVAYNTDKNSLLATGIPIQDLANLVKERVQCDRVVIIMDACHSGAAVEDRGAKGLFRVTNVSADEMFQGSGQLVVCSSQPNQVSWESKRYENGVFTHYLLEGLRKNGSNTKIGEACNYMRDMVEQEVRTDRGEMQTPVMRSKWEGNDLVVAVSPSETRSDLPDDGSTSAWDDNTKKNAVNALAASKSTPAKPQKSISNSAKTPAAKKN